MADDFSWLGNWRWRAQFIAAWNDASRASPGAAARARKYLHEVWWPTQRPTTESEQKLVALRRLSGLLMRRMVRSAEHG